MHHPRCLWLHIVDVFKWISRITLDCYDSSVHTLESNYIIVPYSYFVTLTSSNMFVSIDSSHQKRRRRRSDFFHPPCFRIWDSSKAWLFSMFPFRLIKSDLSKSCAHHGLVGWILPTSIRAVISSQPVAWVKNRGLLYYPSGD